MLDTDGEQAVGALDKFFAVLIERLHLDLLKAFNRFIETRNG